MILTKIESRRTGFRLTFNDHDVVEVDYVIIAIPFTVLRHVDMRVELPKRLRRFINEVDLSRNEKVFAGFGKKVWRQDGGFVQEAWTDLGFSEVWDETQRQPERDDGVLTFLVGGDQVLAMQATTAEAQGKKFVNRLAEFIPEAKDAAIGRFVRTRWANTRFAGGGYTTFRPGQYTEFADFLYIESDDPEERQDVNVGNLVFAGEHLSDEFYGYMNGAAQTGRLAAEVTARLIEETLAKNNPQPAIHLTE